MLYFYLALALFFGVRPFHHLVKFIVKLFYGFNYKELSLIFLFPSVFLWFIGADAGKVFDRMCQMNIPESRENIYLTISALLFVVIIILIITAPALITFLSY